MEELKLLVDMVAHLPQMALWVVAAFLVYKMSVLASIYGTIRYVTGQTVAWLREKKAAPVEYKEIRPMLDGMCIPAETEAFIAQIHRIRGKGVSIPTSFIHRQSVDWLRQAIDDKIAKDAAEEHLK